MLRFTRISVVSCQPSLRRWSPVARRHSSSQPLTGFQPTSEPLPQPRGPTTVSKPDGFILGVDENGKLTPYAETVNKSLHGQLTAHLKPKLRKGDCRYFLGLSDEYPRIALVSVGKPPVADKGELLIEQSRVAAAVGVRALKRLGAKHIRCDPLYDEKGTSEGAHLALYDSREFKSKKKEKEERSGEGGETKHTAADVKRMAAAATNTATSTSSDSSSESATAAEAAEAEKPITLDLAETNDGLQKGPGIGQWAGGKALAEAQNFARDLANAPANVLTPAEFVRRVKERLQDCAHVEVFERDEAWVRDKKMGLFLGVAQGSKVPLRFLEVHYKGRDPSGGLSGGGPLVLLGKGITFDSGGISIKPSSNMHLMKGDMGGAAAVMAAVSTIASLGIPEDVVALAPLCENMPSGHATKPGDVLTSMSGKTVEVDNTDAEGRLILADALTYAQSLEPEVIVDVATLTGAIDVALGTLYYGVFCNSQEVINTLGAATYKSGELGWVMPLDPDYKDQLRSDVADILNCSRDRSGGACTAAIFLKEFIGKNQPWLHLDIAGVMHRKSVKHYHAEGMTGAPTRTLIEFVISHHLRKKRLEEEGGSGISS